MTTEVFKNGMSPVHPGSVLKEMFMEPLNIGAEDLAKHINVTKQRIEAILDGVGSIDGYLAVAFSSAFNTTPQFWFNLQNTYDLRRVEIEIQQRGIRLDSIANKEV